MSLGILKMLTDTVHTISEKIWQVRLKMVTKLSKVIRIGMVTHGAEVVAFAEGIVIFVEATMVHAAEVLVHAAAIMALVEVTEDR